jgi:hypothetical protein
MTIQALASEAERFVKSSAYRFGDRTGFAVQLHESISLPGNNSAADYLDKLGLESVPERVAVVCPGNGGLVAECFTRGAKFVLALEPRPRFNAGLQGVFDLLDKVWQLEETNDLSHAWVEEWWPQIDQDGYTDFDLILWPEGVEEITTPKAIFQGLADLLLPGGKLIVELSVGNRPWVEKINSWRPSKEAVLDMSKEIFDGETLDEQAGRNDTARIYTLILPGKAAEVAE